MVNISIADFARQLGQIMPEVMKGFLRRQHNDIYKCKITLPQMMILELISRQGPVKMTDLAKFMKVTTAASTGIVRRLVSLGYVQREYNQEDRRIIKIRISTRGSELLKKIHQQRSQVVTKVFSQISEHDRGEYLRILMQVRDILNREENLNETV